MVIVNIVSMIIWEWSEWFCLCNDLALTRAVVKSGFRCLFSCLYCSHTFISISNPSRAKAALFWSKSLKPGWFLNLIQASVPFETGGYNLQSSCLKLISQTAVDILLTSYTLWLGFKWFPTNNSMGMDGFQPSVHKGSTIITYMIDILSSNSRNEDDMYLILCLTENTLKWLNVKKRKKSISALTCAIILNLAPEIKNSKWDYQECQSKSWGNFELTKVGNNFTRLWTLDRHVSSMRIMSEPDLGSVFLGQSQLQASLTFTSLFSRATRSLSAGP